MDQALEKKVESEWREWLGPNYNDNAYCHAQYRVSTRSVRLGNLEVPTRVEALTIYGEWQQHPVVFLHYGDNEAEKRGEGIVVIFLSNKRYTTRETHLLRDGHIAVDLYRQAERMGLTEGSRAFVKSIPKEDW